MLLDGIKTEDLYRDLPGDVSPTCAHCDATDDLRADRNGTLWCLTCAVAHDGEVAE